MSACMAFDLNANVYHTTPIYNTLITDFPVSLAGWSYINNSSSGLEFAFMVTTTNVSDFFLFTYDNTDCYSWIRGGGDFTGTKVSYSIGQWQHFAAVATSTTQKLYIDGVEAYSVAHTATWGTPDHMALGGRPSGTSLSRLDGKLAFVQLYNKELSVQEVQEIMHHPYSQVDNCLFHAPGLYGSYSAASDIKDISIQNNNMEGGTAPSSSNTGPPVSLKNLQMI